MSNDIFFLMCVDPNLVSLVSSFVDTEKNEVSICCSVDSQTKFGFTEHRILFANESHIFVFETKKKQINPIITKTWFDIKRVISPKEEEMQIIFDNMSVEFHHQSVPLILKTMIQYLYNILTDIEMPEVDLETFDYTILKKSNFAIYYRFRALILSENFETPEDLCYRVKDFAFAKCDNIDVYTIDPHGLHIPYILKSLQVDSKIKTLTVQTPMKGCLWKDLGDFVSYNTSINHIISYEPLTNEFDYFIEGFKKNPRSKIKKLSILRAKITKKYSKLIGSLVDVHPLDTLCLSNSLLGPTAIEFLSLFEKSRNLQTLNTLILDNTKNVDVSLLVRVTKNIKTLSICSSDIELCLLFGFLAYEETTKLEKLIASNNKAKVNISEQITLPKSLKEIVIQNTEFKGDNLKHILQMANHNPITLDVSRATLHPSAWRRLITDYDSIENPQFTGIGWSDNQIDLETLDFFDRCENMKYLNIGGCLKPNDQIFPTILDFIENNNSITTLDLSVTLKTQVPVSVMPIIIATLGKNKNLLDVDLSGNPIDASCLQTLTDMLMNNRNIRKITFNMMEVNNGMIFKNFFTRLSKRGIPLEFPYPAFDIRRILTQKLIKDDEAKIIEQNIEIITKGDATIDVPNETINQGLKKPIKRRIEPYGENRIPSDESVIQSYKDSDPKEWEVLQPQIPRPDDEKYLLSLKETFNIDQLVDSLIN